MLRANLICQNIKILRNKNFLEMLSKFHAHSGAICLIMLRTFSTNAAHIHSSERRENHGIGIVVSEGIDNKSIIDEQCQISITRRS